MGKRVTLLLIVMLAASTLIVVESASAQSTLKPSVPEFTLQLEDNWLKVTVQNQPVIPNGHDSAGIFYDARFKWHESANWYPSETNSNQGYYVRETDTSGTTIWLISTNGFYELLGKSRSHQLDYQIRAINGYPNNSIMYSSPFGGVDPNSRPIIIVDASDWSNVQTITIPEGQTTTPSPSPSPTATPPPAQTSTPTPSREPALTPEDIAPIIGAAIIIAVISAGVGLLIYLIKRK